MNEQIISSLEDSNPVTSFYQAIIENASDGVVILDATQRYSYISPNAYKMFGYDHIEMRTLVPEELCYPDDAEYVFAEIQKALQNPDYKPTIEYRFRKKNGEWLWIESKISNLLSHPNVNGLVINFKDITERKANIDRLKIISDLQSVVFEIGSKFMITSLSDVDNQINSALEILGRFVNADRTYVFSYDFEHKVAVNTHEWCKEGVEPQINNLQHVPLDEMGYWPQKHAKGELIEIPDMEFEKDEEVKKALSEQGIKSLIAIPIMQNTTCIGFAGIDSVSKMNIFNHNVINILKLFLHQLSDFFTKLNAESLLRISETRYRLTQEVGGIGSWEYDIQSNKYWSSPQLYKIFGIEENSTNINAEIENIVHNNDFIKATLSKLIDENAAYNIEYQITRKNDNALRIIKDIAILYLDKDGNPDTVRGILTDITDSKLNEQKLKHSEALLAATLIHSRFSIWSVDLNHKLIYTNDTFANDILQTFGVKLEVGMKLNEVLPKQMAVLWLDRYNRTFANESFVEEDVVDLGDRKIYIEISSTPIVIDNKVVGASFYGVDITERKEAEFKIKISEEIANEAARKFDKLFRKNPALLALTDIEHKTYADVNDTFLKLMEYEKSEVIGKNPIELGIIFDMEVFQKAGKILSETGILEGFEMPVKTKSGKILRGLFSGQFIENQGKVFSLTVMVDVTERKYFEQKLLNNTDNLSKILKASNQFVKPKAKDVDFDEVTGILRQISGAKYVIFNRLFSDYSQSVSISGLEKTKETILKFLNVDITNAKWKREVAFESKWVNRKMTILPDIGSVLFTEFKPSVVQLVIEKFNIGNVAIGRIDGNDRVVGNLIFIYEKGKTIENLELVEIFTYQLGQYIERLNAEDALNQKVNEMERFHKLTVNRELNMIDLKKEVNILLKKLGQAEKYRIVN